MAIDVLDGVIRRKGQMIMRIDRDDVRKDVRAFHGEVLNDEVQLIVGILNTRNRLQERISNPASAQRSKIFYSQYTQHAAQAEEQ